GVEYPLPRPFHVLATQNPMEQEGTYPLPEAQLDRFMLQIGLTFPDAEAERAMLLATTGAQSKQVRQVMDAATLMQAQ
ncbi:AAA family ATPase, partial [Staphylococcus capitis]